MKKTKIIATYGPAVQDHRKLLKLVECGVNLFRVNCSHGQKTDFIKAARLIRSSLKQSTFPVGLLFDISGPKLRLERFEGELPFKRGETITLTTQANDLSQRVIRVNHPDIIKSIKKNERVFIDDGNLIFEVISTGKNKARLKALNDGVLLSGKGINLPDSNIKIPTITSKDIDDIKTAVEAKADYIALSFVRSADDIIEARKIIKRAGGDQHVIAKLEKKEAIEDIENIMLVSDGVMIARGDLGVELPFEELPKLQKRIIHLANIHHKPVIVATQMLESMRFSPRATRAEVNDVATAVFDYVDAVMLSAETATGTYPIETVQAMRRVIEASEKELAPAEAKLDEHLISSKTTASIAKAVSFSIEEGLSKYIMAYTASGFTAALISNLYPPQPVIALTNDERVMNKLSLYRSVYAIKQKQPKSIEQMLRQIDAVCLKNRLIKRNERVVITGGVPFGKTQITNFMMIHKTGATR